jgi:mannitol/fructose-specific phosphotransferase system IIA component
MNNDDEIDKMKKIIQDQRAVIKELQNENIMLWNYIDETLEDEKQLMTEMGFVIDDYILRNMKPIGDA